MVELMVCVRGWDAQRSHYTHFMIKNSETQCIYIHEHTTCIFFKAARCSCLVMTAISQTPKVLFLPSFHSSPIDTLYNTSKSITVKIN